jgi:hypothetical protein
VRGPWAGPIVTGTPSRRVPCSVAPFRPRCWPRGSCSCPSRRPLSFVNGTDDVLDAHPGDGDRFTGRVVPGAHGPVRECTLRAAVQEANGAPGFRFGHTVHIPSGFYRLTLSGGPDAAAAEDDQQNRGLLSAAEACRSNDLDVEASDAGVTTRTGLTIAALPPCPRGGA